MELAVSTPGASPLHAWSYEIPFFSMQTLPSPPLFQSLEWDSACVTSVFKNKTDQEESQVPVPTHDGHTVRTGERAAEDNSGIGICQLVKCWSLNLPLGGFPWLLERGQGKSAWREAGGGR